MNKNISITISGADRIGKNCQSKLLAKALNAEWTTFPNYNGIWGQLIRAALTKSHIKLYRELWDFSQPLSGVVVEDREVEGYLDKTVMNPYLFQCIQMCARLEQQEWIEKVLETQSVVFDRYAIDALCYGMVDGCDRKWLEGFLTCIRPSELVIILDGPSFSREEVADVNETNTEFISKVRQIYIDNVNYYGWKIVNTQVLPDKHESMLATHKLVLDVVNKYLGTEHKPLTIENIKEML